MDDQALEKSDMTKDDRNKLVADLKVVVADAEELLRATASQTGERAVSARERINESIHQAKDQLSRAEEAVIDKTRQAARVTDDYIRGNPWQALGVAAGIGLAVGLLIGRR